MYVFDFGLDVLGVDMSSDLAFAKFTTSSRTTTVMHVFDFRLGAFGVGVASDFADQICLFISGRETCTSFGFFGYGRVWCRRTQALSILVHLTADERSETIGVLLATETIDPLAIRAMLRTVGLSTEERVGRWMQTVDSAGLAPVRLSILAPKTSPRSRHLLGCYHKRCSEHAD